MTSKGFLWILLFYMVYLLHRSDSSIYGQKFTDSRRKAENIKDKLKRLKKLFGDFPEIMNEIKNDINNNQYKNIREFVVLEPIAIMNNTIPRFRYEKSVNIFPVLNSLEELEFIKKINQDPLIYQMNESFINQLRSL
jgi:hypothetical protein